MNNTAKAAAAAIWKGLGRTLVARFTVAGV